MNNNKNEINEIFKVAVDYHTKGKINEAKENYLKILRIKPDDHLTLGNLGIIYSQTKQLDKAVEYFTKAIQVNPDNADGYNLSLIHI